MDGSGERAKPISELNPTHPLAALALAGRFKEGADKPLIELDGGLGRRSTRRGSWKARASRIRRPSARGSGA